MIKPSPESDDDKARWRIGELRTRILDGEWTGDLEIKMAEFFDSAVIGRIESARDISRNLARYAWNACNTIYEVSPTAQIAAPHAEPDVETDESSEPADLARIVTPELWPIRSQAQLIVCALGECAVRLDVRGGKIRYRSVSPVFLECYASPDEPSRPVWIRETMCRRRQGQPAVWTRETWDVQDPEAPSFLVERWSQAPGEGSCWIKCTSDYYRPDPAAYRPEYPYWDGAAPVLPYELAHLLISGRLWSPTRWEELVQTTLVLGCLQTFWNAGFRDCAYPLRWAMDVDLPSAASVRGQEPAPDRITTDPSSLTMLHSRSPESKGTTGTFAPTMEPVSSLAALDAKAQAALRDAGLGPADEAPAKGVSGTAITISREALRREQRRQIPAARLADQHVLATAARLANAYLGTSLPTEPESYLLDYHGIPPSTDEVLAAVQRATSLRSAGLTTQARAIGEVYPEMTPAQCEAFAAEINEERAPTEIAGPTADQPAATTPTYKAKYAATVAEAANAAAGAPTDPPSPDQSQEPK